MQKNIFLFCLIFILSCNERKDIAIKQKESNEVVLMYVKLRNNKKDSISLDLPIEFSLNINKLSNLRSVMIHYFLNSRHLYQLDDYNIYDKKSKKIIYAIQELRKENFPDQILIRGGNNLISKKEAESLFKKYKINKSINNLKFGDTIKLVPYNQFKKENNNIINELKKIDDSIFFRINVGKENPILVKHKINW